MRWLLVVGLGGMVGCSGADFVVVEGGDTGGVLIDTGSGVDSSTVDSGSPDSGSPDSGSPDSDSPDSGSKDSSVKDTGSLDTGSLDTGSPDTTVADSLVDAPIDSGIADSALDSASDTLVDSGVDSTVDSGTDTADAVVDGPLCPRPPSTVTIDPGSYPSCSELLAKYPVVLAEAKKCTCDADCGKQIERDFCGCMTNVSPANDAYVALKAMQTRWGKLACTAFCPQVLCVDPPAPKCIFDVSGGPGKCN